MAEQQQDKLYLEEFQSWKAHPTTKRFFQFLKQQRENYKEEWAEARFVNSHDIADVYQNAGAISACSVMKQILEIEADELYEEDDE